MIMIDNFLAPDDVRDIVVLYILTQQTYDVLDVK